MGGSSLPPCANVHYMRGVDGGRRPWGQYCKSGHIMAGMAEWWSIEVFHSEFQAASRWKDSYSSAAAVPGPFGDLCPTM
jgi:hypothetical protein